VRLGESAVERLGRQPPLQVGLASLLLVRGTAQDIERARTLGQGAVDATRPPAPPRPGTRPPPTPTAAPSPLWGTRARLVLAEAYASSSAALALSLLQEVAQRDPGQHRVFNVRAAAHDAAGSPRAAGTDLQSRLAVDPDEPRTTRALARLWGPVCETAQARRLYERLQGSPATQDGPAVIEMAALRAGAERAPAEAGTLLVHAVQRGRLAGADLLRAQICLAGGRAAGDTPVAAQAVAAALTTAPDDAGAPPGTAGRPGPGALTGPPRTSARSSTVSVTPGSPRCSRERFGRPSSAGSPPPRPSIAPPRRMPAAPTPSSGRRRLAMTGRASGPSRALPRRSRRTPSATVPASRRSGRATGSRAPPSDWCS
jgi:hypothetical protein